MRWFVVALALVACSTTTSEERAELAKLDSIFKNPTSIDEVLKQVGEHETGEPLKSWGFGHERMHIRFGKPFSCVVVLTNIEGRLAGWQARCDGTSDRWRVIKAEVLQRYPSFQPNTDPEDYAQFIVIHRREDLYRARDERRAKVLGTMNPVVVPPPLRARYERLTDEFWTSKVGDRDCSTAMLFAEQFAAAGRYDLLRNVLRGPNPGGRAAAALQLLEHGADDSDRAAIRAIGNVPLRNCARSSSEQDETLAGALAKAAHNYSCDAPRPDKGRSAILDVSVELPDLLYAVTRSSVCALRRNEIRPFGGGGTDPKRLVLKIRESANDSATVVATLGDEEHVCRANGTSEEDAVRKATACVVDTLSKAWPTPSPSDAPSSIRRRRRSMRIGCSPIGPEVGCSTAGSRRLPSAQSSLGSSPPCSDREPEVLARCARSALRKLCGVCEVRSRGSVSYQGRIVAVEPRVAPGVTARARRSRASPTAARRCPRCIPRRRTSR